MAEQMNQPLVLVGEINRLHEEICQAARRTIQNAIRIGELLTQRRAELKHGQWLPWLDENINFDQKTAWNYMRLYEERDKLGNVPNLSDAYRRLADIAREEKREDYFQRLSQSTASEAPPLGPFEVIVADPPWQYEFTPSPARRIENQYDTLGLEQIAAHRPDASTDAVLFLWSPTPLLPEALRVMDSWGFRYRSAAIWDKQRLGMGFWFRIQHENLLVGTQGNPLAVPEPARVRSIFSEPWAGHSIKPRTVYEWIERAFPGTQKLEMYARQARPGWAVWGNEI